MIGHNIRTLVYRNVRMLVEDRKQELKGKQKQYGEIEGTRCRASLKHKQITEVIEL